MTTAALIPPKPHGVYDDSALKRQFSEAYARALAAVANVKCSIPPSGDDIDSVDVEFDSGRFGPKGVALGINRKLEVQLKCTTPPQLTRMASPIDGIDSWRFYLEAKDYKRLAIAEAERPYPHVLVVVRVPVAVNEWMCCQGMLTVLRARAWWLDLTDFPASASSKPPVYLPHAQVFDAAAVLSLMKEPA